MSQSLADHRFELGDLFTGPLDLLLYLVRRHEIDAAEIPLTRITGRFLEVLEVLEFLDLEFVGEFIVTAATLTEIKSRLVLPRPEEERPTDESADAPVADEAHDQLVRRLLEYKKFKDAAVALEERAAEWRDRFPRLEDDRPSVERDHAADRIRDVELWDLVSALGRVLRTKEVAKEGHITHDTTPIHVYVERIGTHVRERGRTPFSSFFEGTNDKHRIVGIFLAVLELVRHHSFRAEQPELHGEIWVLPPVADEGEGAVDVADAG